MNAMDEESSLINGEREDLATQDTTVRVKRQRKSTSKIWSVMEKDTTKGEMKCKLLKSDGIVCGQVISNLVTSNAWTHIETKHVDDFKQLKAISNQADGNQVPFNPDTTNRLLARLAGGSPISFRQATSEDMKLLLFSLNKEYEMPSLPKLMKLVADEALAPNYC